VRAPSVALRSFALLLLLVLLVLVVVVLLLLCGVFVSKRAHTLFKKGLLLEKLHRHISVAALDGLLCGG
jgi:hypothetical protein